MKFTCLQENLSRSLGVVSKAVPVKGTLPILLNVLISAENGRLRLSATDLDTSITTYAGASIEEEGAITVPAKLIRDFVSNLSPSTLVVHLSNGLLHLSSDKAKVKFNGISAEDYPDVPIVSNAPSVVEFNPSTFSRAVASVAFAAAADDSRPIFSGVLLNFADNILYIVASDGFRLSEKQIPIENASTPFSVVVPAKTLMEASRIFSSSGEPIKMALNEDDNLALFESEDTLLAIRVLEGQFPDYKRIIPKESVLRSEILASDLLEAAKLANIFTSDGTSSVKVGFNPEGFVTLLSSSQETGEHHSKFEAQVEGDPLEVTFNSKYILDFLNNARVERLIFETNGSSAPCVLKPVDAADFLHIIMPMQMQK